MHRVKSRRAYLSNGAEDARVQQTRPSVSWIKMFEFNRGRYHIHTVLLYKPCGSCTTCKSRSIDSQRRSERKPIGSS